MIIKLYARIIAPPLYFPATVQARPGASISRHSFICWFSDRLKLLIAIHREGGEIFSRHLLLPCPGWLSLLPSCRWPAGKVCTEMSEYLPADKLGSLAGRLRCRNCILLWRAKNMFCILFNFPLICEIFIVWSSHPLTSLYRNNFLLTSPANMTGGWHYLLLTFLINFSLLSS